MNGSRSLPTRLPTAVRRCGKDYHRHRGLHSQLLMRDDASVKNIYLMNRENIHNNSLQSSQLLRRREV